jgi:hypothetical protein
MVVKGGCGQGCTAQQHKWTLGCLQSWENIGNSRVFFVLL